MKKFLVVFSILALAAGAIYAADSSSVAYRGSDTIPDRFGGVVSLLGKTPRTTGPCYVDNTVRTIQSLVERASGTYLGGSDNTLTPISVTVSCESLATMWAFQATPTGSVGHKLAADGSMQFSGPDAIGYLKGIADGASDNVACAVTLWY